jgi:hypothetical protein
VITRIYPLGNTEELINIPIAKQGRKEAKAFWSQLVQMLVHVDFLAVAVIQCKYPEKAVV